MSGNGRERSRVVRGRYAAVVVGLAVSLAACSSGGPPDPAAASEHAGSSEATVAGSSPAEPATATVADRPFGPGCGQFPADGPGSVADLRTALMVTGASRNPQLSTLVHALTAATLVDTLNSTGNITVLAPSDAAFQALPPSSLSKLMADVPRLTAVLTHHVIPGRLGPARFAGPHTTLDNDSVTVSGAGEAFTISGDQTVSGRPAHVVCGDIPTVNATVYVIDQVLKPQHLG
jgi:uncharacterized surface protein with fasciclin (FAS1) repeats